MSSRRSSPAGSCPSGPAGTAPPRGRPGDAALASLAAMLSHGIPLNGSQQQEEPVIWCWVDEIAKWEDPA